MKNGTFVKLFFDLLEFRIFVESIMEQGRYASADLDSRRLLPESFRTCVEHEIHHIQKSVFIERRDFLASWKMSEKKKNTFSQRPEEVEDELKNYNYLILLHRGNILSIIKHIPHKSQENPPLLYSKY